METLDQIIRRMRQTLQAAGIENPALDARLLVREGGQFSDENMISLGQSPLNQQVIENIEKLVERRLAGEGVSRIIGRREFWGLDFALTPDTLEPRPDTEILVEKALEFIRKNHPQAEDLRILDLGTGSGCILISLLTELPQATGLGIDLNPGAVKAAQANAEALGVASRAEFRQGSWLEPLQKGESFGLIVSNPPYIPNLDVPNLAKEVKNHDPILALAGGEDGLDPYRLLFTEIKTVIKMGGHAFFEIGFGQLPDIARLVDDSDATLKAAYPDLAGIPRVVEICYGDNE